MKKVALSLALVTLLAGTAHAYVQVGHLAQPRNDAQAGPQQNRSTASTEVVWRGASVEPIGAASGQPAAPVPEPGTIALASLGLLAVGAARKRRRQGNK